MRECILSLIWPKKDIHSFFINNGCTKSDIKIISNYQELKRIEIINKMFDHLSSKPDSGLGPFRTMLKSLLEWSDFNRYYFDTLKKLDRDKAKKNIEHLKQLQQIWDGKIRLERMHKEEKKSNQQQPRYTLEKLRNDFLELHKGKISF